MKGDERTREERIAMMLDGRLTEAERSELLRGLSVDDEELEVLVDAACVTRDLENEDRASARSPAFAAAVLDGVRSKRAMVTSVIVIIAALVIALINWLA